MKRCPECRRDYYDDTLLYCLDDGTPLLDGPASGSTGLGESATAIFHGADVLSQARTKAQIHTTEQTAVLPSGVGKGEFWLFQVKYDPAYDGLRGDPRFQALVKKFDPPQ